MYISIIRMDISCGNYYSSYMFKYHKIQNGGFTLIEVLIVIGIIAVLATMVLVAVNPARQFKLARDSQRTSNINAILNAVHQNIVEHRGTFVCSDTPRSIPATSTVISSDPIGGLGDMADCLVPDYLSALPFDPSLVGAHYMNTTDYDTGYMISRDDDSRITVSAIAELEDSISVVR